MSLLFYLVYFGVFFTGIFEQEREPEKHKIVVQDPEKFT